MSRETTSSGPEHRASRRGRQTRARLLRAALQLMADTGVEGVAINDITEVADVGFGTFYNYFESKEAIYEALVKEVFDSLGGALDRIAEQVDDPAAVVAASVRYTVRRAYQEPVWGRFLVRTGFYWPRVLEQGLGPRMLRDLQNGVAAGRFHADDLATTVLAVRGVILSAVDVQTELATRYTGDRGFAEILGNDDQRIPERTAAVVLRLVGLEPEEAVEVACRPLAGDRGTPDDQAPVPP